MFHYSLSSLLRNSTILLSMSVLGGVAFAQVTPDINGVKRLETVTVTSQRIEENLQDVPISMTEVSGEKLDNLRAGGADIRFLSARVPSVTAESSFGRAFPRFYIRGIGNTDFDLNASQPVSLVYDDVPYESPILKGYPVFDIARVEVLRGPQGTLFGRNTPGGIIKFDSVRPSDEVDGYIRAAYGNYNSYELEGAIGGPISETVTGRLSGLFQHRDDYVDNAFTGQENAYEGFDEWAVRGQAHWTPHERFNVLFNLHARENESSTRLFRANIIDQGQRGLGRNWDRDTVSYDALNGLTQTAWGTTIRAEGEITDSLTATYILGYETAELSSRGDIDGGVAGTGPGFIPFGSETEGKVNDLDQTTHEVRLAYDAGTDWRWQAGVFFFEENVDITSSAFATSAPGRPAFSRANRANETSSQSIFAAVDWDATERLTLSAGGRFTDESKDFAVERIAPSANPSGLVSGSVGDENFSWNLSANYAATDQTNLYARIATGFRAPSIQGRLLFGGSAVSIADSETVISYEAGAKSELFDNRLRANLGIFFYELNDQQLTIVGGLTNTVQLFNADKSEGYGFEADIEALPLDNLLLTAGVSYNHTEFLDDVILAQGCGAPCTIRDPAVRDAGNNLLGYNISGNPFPNSPEWIVNLTGRYSIALERGGDLYIYTDWAYKSETNFVLYDSVEYGEDGYWEGGVRVGYLADANWEASLYARNILDEERLTGGIDFNNLTGFVNEPRTLGVEVKWTY